MGGQASAAVGQAGQGLVDTFSKAKAPKTEKEARQIFERLDLQPWDSRGLIRSVLNKQAELAKRSQLRKVPVDDGFKKIIGDEKKQDAARGLFGRDISKKVFVELCVDLFREQQIPGSFAEQEQELSEIYDTIDFDHSGGLDISEIAAGLSVFLAGSKEDHVKAVFKAIDVDHSGSLEMDELQVYLRPFVKGMTPRDFPAEAEPLREYLVVRASRQIWKELVEVAGRTVKKDLLGIKVPPKDHLGKETVLDWTEKGAKRPADDMAEDERKRFGVSKDGKFTPIGAVKADDMVKWAQRGNNIIDSLGKVIEKEIYMFWLSSSKRKTQWHVHKQERDAKEERLQALESERRLKATGPDSGAALPGAGTAPPSPSQQQQLGWQQPQQGLPPQQAWPSQVEPQQEAADGGGWLGSWWPRPESQSQGPPPSAISQALGPPSPDRYSQAHHWNIPAPPPPPSRGQPSQQSLGQFSEQSPVLSQARSMQSAHSAQSQQSAHSAAYFTPQSQQSLGESASAWPRSPPRTGALSSAAYVPSSPSYSGGGATASAGVSPRYYAGVR